MSRIAVTIPAYEAVHSVGAVVSRTRALMPDVLVIDDGSRDGTAEAARVRLTTAPTEWTASYAGMVTAIRLMFARAAATMQRLPKPGLSPV